MTHAEFVKIVRHDNKWGRTYTISVGDDPPFERVSTTTRLEALHSENLVRWRIRREQEIIKAAAHMSAGNAVDPTTFLLAFEENIKRERARREHENVAASVGEEVHEMINAVCRQMMGEDVSVPSPLSEEADIAFHAWKDWAKQVRLMPLATELPIWTDRSAGTIDFVGEAQGHVVVADWKTGSTLYPEYDLQIAEYFSGYASMRLNGMLVDAPGADFGLILHLPKTADKKPIARFRSVDDMTTDLTVYSAVCVADDWLRHNALKKSLAVGVY